MMFKMSTSLEYYLDMVIISTYEITGAILVVIVWYLDL